jgi:dihydroorotase
MVRFENISWVDPKGVLVPGPLVVRGDDDAACPAGADAADGPGTVVDGAGGVVLPGLVDPHVHLREPGRAYKEGIANGTRAALAGGVTTVLVMPNDVPPTVTEALLSRKRQRFERKSSVRWGLFLQAPAAGPVPRCARIAGVKVYLSRASSQPAIHDRARLAEIFAAADTVAVHAEDESRFVKSGSRHQDMRPRDAVTSALEKVRSVLESLPAGDRPRLVLCHAATCEELVWLAEAKAMGMDVWGETCPHYAQFTQEDHESVGPLLQVNPPLRTERDRAAIAAALRDGPIDFLGTDHAPHTRAEKQSATPPSGIAGIEWFAPWLVQQVERGLLSWARALDLGARNAAQCYGIPLPGLTCPGPYRDAVLLQRIESRGPRPRWVRGRRPTVTKAGWNPYAHAGLEWAVTACVVDGRLAYREGRFADGPMGKEVYA